MKSLYKKGIAAFFFICKKIRITGKLNGYIFVNKSKNKGDRTILRSVSFCAYFFLDLYLLRSHPKVLCE